MTDSAASSHVVDVDAVSLVQYKGKGLAEKVDAVIASDKVVVFGRSTCPFCIEVTRTMATMGVAFTYIKLDQLSATPAELAGPAVLEHLRETTGQRTVPFVYINGSLVGGCNDTKALIDSGEFDMLVGDGDSATKEAIKGLAGVDLSAPSVTGALLEFPQTVDGRVIRWTGVQVFVVCVVIAAMSYLEYRSVKWLSVGLLTDFCLRFYGGAGVSPLGSISMLVVALWDLVGGRWLGRATGPVWGAGPPKQFAVSVGVMFSTIIVVLQFTKQWQAATAFAAVLAFFAGLEGFINFCAGCWFFGHAIRFGIIPDTVYMQHINLLAETKYTWEEFTKVVHPPVPERVTFQFEGHGAPTKVDLHYKTGKTDDWEREDFAVVKHSKIAFQSSVIGVAAVAALFKFMSISPRFATPDLVWQILTLLSLVHTVVFTAPYVGKMIMYPKKVRSEWMHPAMNNAFSVPSMTLAVYAFLSWEFYSTALARVLFWAGSSTGTALAVITIGNWLSTLRHDGHMNGSWMMAPVGLFIFAVVGPIIDPGYTQVCFLFFGFATLMWVVLFASLFPRFALGPNADPRMRMFAAIWVAAPAVASIAWAVLNAGGLEQIGSMNNAPPIAITQSLFYAAVSIAMVVAWMVWRRFLYADKFFMQMWAFGFPTAGLAWAAVLYDLTVQTALTKVLAVCLISLASIVCFVLTLRTYTGILRLKVFIPEHKWGPMSQLPLAQEGMRAMLAKIKVTADHLAERPDNARLFSTLRTQWATFEGVNDFYCGLKQNTCFPIIASYFPGHPKTAFKLNDELLAAQHRISEMIEAAEPATSAAKGVNQYVLSDAIAAFVQKANSTFDYVEDNIKPVVRRYMSGPIQVKTMKDCWDNADPAGWWLSLPAIVQSLPMHSQRVTFVRAFVWAMPERCQQIGTMISLGVDPVVWERLRHSVAEIIPRGEDGWKRF